MCQKICCFTGHREIPEEDFQPLMKLLEDTVRKLVQKGAAEFRAGGARGFDMLAAQTVLRLQEEMPQIRLVLMLPHREQSRGWSDEEKAIYEEICEKAASKSYISEHYTRGCMQRRNRQLVEGSCWCVSYCTKDTGGTAYTMAYAQKNGVEILNLAEWLTSWPDYI